jgi:L-iditol 2-dehydrogenase
MINIKSTMFAAQIYGPQKVQVSEVPVPVPEPDDVLLRVISCGICPSDVRFYQGIFRGTPEYPVVAGHEWVGEVVALGSNVKHIEMGQKVAVDYHIPCGYCHYCRSGFPNYCENLVRKQGGFAQYALARAKSIHLIPEGVSYKAASFCEPLACCLNGIETLRIKIGDTVVVLGCGPIGLLHVQLALALGASVIGIDLLSERLEIASRLGAKKTVLAGENDLVTEVRRLTGGRGADGVVITIGDPEMMNYAVEMAAPTGVVNAFAGFYPDGKTNFDFNLVHYRQITITGSHDFLPRHFQAALRAIEEKTIRVEELISHVFSLKEIKKGLNLVARREGMKVIIVPQD